MEENNPFILLRSEPEALTMYKDPALKINNLSLIKEKPYLNKSLYYNNKNESKKNKFEGKLIKKLKNSASAMNLTANKTQKILGLNQLNFIPEIPIQGKTYSSLDKRDMTNQIKRVNFNLKKKNLEQTSEQFYMTSPLESIYNSIHKKNQKYMIDLIHKKEIQLCLDLIKKLPDKESKNNFEKKEEDKDNYAQQAQEADNLIELIKRFKFDDIYNQKIIEHQILNENNNNSFENNNSEINSKNMKAEINPGETQSISLSTNFRTKNFLSNTQNQNISNLFNTKNFNNSSIDLKNISISNVNNQNSSQELNDKSKISKSPVSKNIKTNKSNIITSFSPKKFNFNLQSEINFHTGFVRSQKNLYNDAYKSIFQQKNKFSQKNMKKAKKESEKLSLPEIEEYKSIIKEIKNRKKKKLQKSSSVKEIRKKKEKDESDLKDKLVEKLNNIYEDQKNIFLNDLQENFGENNNKIKYDPLKVEINENIRKINSVKRTQNYFNDIYSLYDGKINKRLDDFNYILGDRFYDKEQKKEKEEKFHKCVEEFENKIKKYKKELLKEQKEYKKIFKQKIDFKKDKNLDNFEFNFDEKYIIH